MLISPTQKLPELVLSSQFPLQPKDYCLLYGRNDDKSDMTYSTDRCVSSVSVSARDSQKELAGCGSSSVVLFSIMPTRRLETWRVHTLADASPLGEFYRRGHVVSHQLHIRAHGEALELPGKASMAGDCVSTSCPNRNNSKNKKVALTPYALAVRSLLLVEDGVLVLGQHLLLARHLRVPSLDGLDARDAVALQGRADGVDDLVDMAKALALARLLVAGEAPGDLPVESRKRWLADAF